eukprot:CAMPEP_0180596356 /NCGR_PEP_ID=MMETSP1037_2-20121125/21766_1 /TAXON_ID=632150 /ORGANISM="Azadinium spinosum, Strain 3D9" /LENGTH=194 /DNA_ID=CAMNT_0022614849 /DNA_START=687 /DNA_END=1268 /DNA_ORIENTATION=-
MRTKTTQELFAQDMGFGVRFAYDFGKCMGRCFSNNLCTGSEDCGNQYSKYGYVVGCNNFWDKSTFPDTDTTAPNGIWWSWPLEGRCDHPTGTRNCTWSYEEAGEVTLKELEEMAPGGGNCCYGRCSAFWDGVFDSGMTSWRARMALRKFEEKYPSKKTLPAWAAKCNYKNQKWYPTDTWARRDPWAKAKKKASS